MKKETRQAMRELAYFSSLGLAVAFSIFIGLFLGVFIDKWIGTSPWFMLLGLGFGIAAGFSNIALAVKKSKRL